MIFDPYVSHYHHHTKASIVENCGRAKEKMKEGGKELATCLDTNQRLASWVIDSPLRSIVSR